MDAETQRYIKQQIQQMLNIMLPGVSQNATGTNEDIDNMYPGQDVISARPTVRPYGFVSRAPTGTAQVTARMGSHPANRMIVGHRDDENAPSLPDLGDAAVYSPGGKLLALKDRLQLLAASGFVIEAGPAGVKMGKGSATVTAVSGEDLIQFLSALVDAIVAHTHNGFTTSPPDNAATFNAQKAQYLTSSLVLVKTGGKF